MKVDNDIQKLHKCLRLILDEIDRICQKNNIPYFLDSGSALGAIRHKGFIPWDDDVDVAMPRKDYKEFLRVASHELQQDMNMTYTGNNKEYRYSFARISTKRMQIINHSANIPRVEDAWIDIIPLDGLPENKIVRNIHKIHMFFWRSLNQIAQYDELVDQKRKRGIIGTIVVKIAGFKFFRGIISYKKCLKHLDTVLEKYSYDECDVVINYVAAYGFKETFNKKALGNGKKYLFEDSYFSGPIDGDYVCKTIYGDYMTLPPASERNKHNAEIVK